MAVRLAKAHDPLVVAIDIGSSASRARIFDAEATPVRGTRLRLPHAIATGPDGAAVIDADLILAQVGDLLDGVLDERGLEGRIAAVAMDTFASTLVGVGPDGETLTPCLTYADARPAEQVRRLRAEMDEAAVQQRTGCRIGSSYLTAQIAWLNATQPEVVARVSRWLSLGEYVMLRLTGRVATSFSTAAWTGLLDRRAGRWDTDLIEAVGARPEQFSPIHDTPDPLPLADTPAVRRWPALARAAWFPAIADGFASNVGSGALDTRTLALAAGTTGALRVLVPGSPEFVPPGLWCYRVDGQRSLAGGALNDVGRLAAWLRERFRLPEEPALDAALRAAPGPSVPAILPFLTGERSPGWAAAARAVIADLTAATDALAIWRGAMEALALRYALIAEQLATVAPETSRVVASGGVVETTPGWLQVIADALGRPVDRSAEQGATLLGTARIALDVVAPDTARPPAAVAETFAPVAGRAAHYGEARRRQDELYAALIGAPALPGAVTTARPEAEVPP